LNARLGLIAGAGMLLALAAPVAAEAATANVLPSYMSATPYATSIATGWSASPTAHAGITAYHVQLALAASGVVVIDDRITGTSYRFTGLVPSTRYEWRLAVGQDRWHLASPWSSWRVISTLAGPPPPPGQPMPDGVPASQVGPLELDADGAAMLAWQHTPTGNQGQDKPGTYGLDAAGDLSLSIDGTVGSFCQVWGPAFGPDGIYESRVFLPADPGNGSIADWPAWWLYGGNNADELDIIEGLGGRSASHLWWPGGNAGLGWSGIGPGWHTGTAVITASSVTVYIDGVRFGSYGRNPLATQLHVIEDIMAGTPPGDNAGPPAVFLAAYTRVWEVR
jgi:hypothetical protein